MKTTSENSAKMFCRNICISPKDRFVIGKDSATRIVLEDRKKGKLLFNTLHTSSKEYSLLNTALAVGAVALGALCAAASLKKSIERKKELKAKTKEVKHLKKLCRKNSVLQDKKL